MSYKDKIEHPWQSGPTELIAHAIEHLHKGTEFDNRIAFLLLDVGVETLFKTFLMLPEEVTGAKTSYQKRKNAATGSSHTIEDEKRRPQRDLKFHDLIIGVWEAKPEIKKDFDLTHVEFLHDKRNALYHDGNGITIERDNLDLYSSLAVGLLKYLLVIDLNGMLHVSTNEAQAQELIPTNQLHLLARIRKNIASLEFNSSLMVEHLYPKIVTRKIDSQLRHIRTTTGPDDESYQPSVRVEFMQQRIDAFNNITGWNFTEEDHEFVEDIIDNPELLLIWLAFEEISDDDWRKDLTEYKSVVDLLERDLAKASKIDDKKYDEIDRWVNEKAKSVYEWVLVHIPDVTPKEYVLISLF